MPVVCLGWQVNGSRAPMDCRFRDAIESTLPLVPLDLRASGDLRQPINLIGAKAGENRAVRRGARHGGTASGGTACPPRINAANAKRP